MTTIQISRLTTRQLKNYNIKNICVLNLKIYSVLKLTLELTSAHYYFVLYFRVCCQPQPLASQAVVHIPTHTPVRLPPRTG